MLKLLLCGHDYTADENIQYCYGQNWQIRYFLDFKGLEVDCFVKVKNSNVIMDQHDNNKKSKETRQK